MGGDLNLEKSKISESRRIRKKNRKFKQYVAGFSFFYPSRIIIQIRFFIERAKLLYRGVSYIYIRLVFSRVFSIVLMRDQKRRRNTFLLLGKLFSVVLNLKKREILFFKLSFLSYFIFTPL